MPVTVSQAHNATKIPPPACLPAHRSSVPCAPRATSAYRRDWPIPSGLPDARSRRGGVVLNEVHLPAICPSQKCLGGVCARAIPQLLYACCMLMLYAMLAACICLSYMGWHPKSFCKYRCKVVAMPAPPMPKSDSEDDMPARYLHHYPKAAVLFHSS